MPEPRDDADRRLLNGIREYGWYSITVEGDREGPGFVYSIGLPTTWSHPEVIVLGVPQRLGHDVIQSIVDALKSGHTFAHGEESEAVLDGYPVAFVSVDRRHYNDYLGYARWYHGGDDFPLLQCVLPDRGGYYPWDDGCRISALRLQPILNAEYAARVPPIDPAWPFEAPKHRAVFTTGQVIDQGLPILEVSHDHEDDWIFLTRPSTGPEDGKLVALHSLHDLDPTLAQLADLPPGWWAWREAVGEPWQREVLPDDEDGE